MPENLENSAVATGLEKVSFHSNLKKAMPKNVQTTTQLHSPHMLAKLCSKFSKPGFNSMWTMNSQRSNCQYPLDHRKNKKSSRKTSTSALLTTPKPLTVWITTNCGKSFKRWEYQSTWPASWEICMQVKKQQLKLEQQTGSKSGKEYIKAVYHHPAYLTYIHNTSYKMPGWMKHILESRLLGEISLTSNMQMTPPLWQKEKKNLKASWWKWKKNVKKLA